MGAEPWSKFFWSDYEADQGLRVCSLAAQGLWMRMLCVMARATPKGELRIAGEPCSVQDLAIYASASEETVAALLDELRRRGVFSTSRAGVIFSRRMRKDAEISRKRSESGAKGAAVSNLKNNGNSDLPQQKSSKASGKSPAPETRSQSSVSNETGVPPPKIDPIKRLFDSGVALLERHGTPPPKARSLIGKWRREAGDDGAQRLIDSADSGQVAEPVEWITAAIRNGEHKRMGELSSLFAHAERMGRA